MTTEHTLGLTAAAEARFDDYLAQMRHALAGAADVSAAEVEADIREHVENELRDAARPVEAFVLEAVLRRLGPPTQWMPTGRPAAPSVSVGQFLKARWRAAVDALWRGPEDWRLAYLSFGVFAFGVLTFILFPLGLVVSFILSRAGLAVAAERGIAVGGGRKWLLYPPVVIVSLALSLTVIAVPFGITAGVAAGAEAFDASERWELAGRPLISEGRYTVRLSPGSVARQYPDLVTRLDRTLAAFPGNKATREVFGVLFAGAGVMLAWWAVVCGVVSSFPGFARGLVFPLAQGFPGRRAGWVGTACLVLLAVWGAAAYRIAEAAGLL